MARNVRYPADLLGNIGLRSKHVYLQKEIEMFTVISNTRKTSLYPIVLLAIIMIALLTFAVVSFVAAPKPILIPVTGISETSDYYQRHPELRISAAPAVEMNSDFYQRHPEWSSNVQNIVPVTGNAELSDYVQRHPELSAPSTFVDTSDYFLRH